MRPDPAAVVSRGFHYEGRLMVLESFPVQLSATVRVTNVGSRPGALTFPDGCMVLLRAYAGDRRVWDQAGSGACSAVIQSVSLGTGESREFSNRASAYDVLGKELANGRYRMTAYLRPDGEVVEVQLGEVDLAVPRN